MKNSSIGGKIITVLIVVVILYIIGSAVDGSRPKCIKSGCNNDRAPESMYCYLHKSSGNSTYKDSYSGTTRGTTVSTTEVTTRQAGETTTVTTREEPTTRAWKDNVSYKNNSSSNPYKSYDDGYDDVYMDGEYDDDIYNSDSDYADGVDDAIEDDYEDGDW